MGNTTNGLELRKRRLEAKVSARELGRAMGYGGKSPHARVFHIEGQHTVSAEMSAKYLAALAQLKGGQE